MTMITNRSGQRSTRLSETWLQVCRLQPTITLMGTDYDLIYFLICYRVSYCIVNGSLLIQMHSDYLTEAKICQMFQDQQDEHNQVHKKQESSLNFTVTSRQSRTCFPVIGNVIVQDHDQKDYDNKNKSQAIIMGHNYNSFTSQIEKSSAEKQLKRFNKWMQDFNKQNQKLLDELSTLNSLAQNSKPQLLYPLDLTYLRKVCSKSTKLNAIGEESKNSHLQMDKPCINCKQKDEFIEIVREQYTVKLQQCRKYQESILSLQKNLQNQFKFNLRNHLLDGVELSLANEEKEMLNCQISNLKVDIQKFKMERSTLLQKSNSFLKTKQLSEKRLQSAGNSKLFSNAKYSTNALNPNDTMNRMQSLICYGQSQPNIEQLIKYFGEQMQAMRHKCKQLISEEEKATNQRFNKDARNSFIRERPQCKLMELYKTVRNNLIQIKIFKQKQTYLFTGGLRERKIQQEQTIMSQYENDELKRIISDLERKIKCIQNEKNNLNETNSDIVSTLNTHANKIKQLQEDIKIKNEELSRYYHNEMRAKKQYTSLYESYKTTAIHRKRLLYQYQQLKGMNRVYCRVRPKFGHQQKFKNTITYSQQTKIIKDQNQYQFNYVFTQKSNQTDIFNEIKGLVECAFDGRNLCIMAYGQVGTGKTHTLHGSLHEPGLGRYIIQALFQEKNKVGPLYDICFVVNYVQIFKEEIRGITGISGKIQIKQDLLRGTYFEDCKSVRVYSIQQLLEIYQNSVIRRNYSQQEGNGRCHSIFTITIQHYKKNMKDKEKEKQLFKTSKICLVDLASVQKSTSNPLTSKIVQNSNKGFTNLISVFSALKNKSENIPYKDSKLTYFLKQFLNRQSMIVTFINISPCEHHNIMQPFSSLTFGMKIKGTQKQMVLRLRDTKENKENQKNRRSSTRLSIS